MRLPARGVYAHGREIRSTLTVSQWGCRLLGLMTLMFVLASHLGIWPFRRSSTLETITLETSSFLSQPRANCADVASSYGPQDLVGIYGSMVAQYHRDIGSYSRISDTLFDQGMLHTYGFNTVEGIRNFKAALVMDPGCAMCYWGISYANGPNINTDVTSLMAKDSREAIKSAMVVVNSLQTKIIGDADMALIAAQSKILSPVSQDEWSDEMQKKIDEMYMIEMRGAAARFPNDVDISAMYAESIINLSPWDYYKPQITDQPRELKESMKVAMAVLRSVLDKSPYHPLALHLWIHITESSSDPSQGEPEADALALLSDRGTGTSHLLHMPAHIYLRVGRYHDAITSSVKAIQADDMYIEKCLVPYVPLHNVAMLVAASLLSGSFVGALEYSPFTTTSIPDMAAVHLPALFPTPKDIILVRMGKWQDIIDLFDKTPSAPNADEGQYDKSELLRVRRSKHDRSTLKSSDSPGRLLVENLSQAAARPPYIQAMHAYSKTLAHIGLNDLKSAEESLNLLSVSVDNIPYDALPVDHPFYPNHHEIGEIFLAIGMAAYLMKKGGTTIEENEAALEGAIASMVSAVHIQSSFSYMEPEHFYFPTRQCLGALLVRKLSLSGKNGGGDKALRESLIHEAINVYVVDLRDHPNNIWSLRGLQNAYALAEDSGIAIVDKFLTLQASINAAMHYASEGFKVIGGSCCELSLC